MQSFIISDYYLDHFYEGSGDAFCTLTDVNGNKIHTSLYPITEENLDGKIVQAYPLLLQKWHTFSPAKDSIGVYSRKIVGKIVRDENIVRLDVNGVIWKVYKPAPGDFPKIETLDQICDDLSLGEGDLIEISSTISMTGVRGGLIPFFPVKLEIIKDEPFVSKSQIVWTT